MPGGPMLSEKSSPHGSPESQPARQAYPKGWQLAAFSGATGTMLVGLVALLGSALRGLDGSLVFGLQAVVLVVLTASSGLLASRATSWLFGSCPRPRGDRRG